jgi:hypothetical protein
MSIVALIPPVERTMIISVELLFDSTTKKQDSRRHRFHCAVRTWPVENSTFGRKISLADSVRSSDDNPIVDDILSIVSGVSRRENMWSILDRNINLKVTIVSSNIQK